MDVGAALDRKNVSLLLSSITLWWTNWLCRIKTAVIQTQQQLGCCGQTPHTFTSVHAVVRDEAGQGSTQTSWWWWCHQPGRRWEPDRPFTAACKIVDLWPRAKWWKKASLQGGILINLTVKSNKVKMAQPFNSRLWQNQWQTGTELFNFSCVYKKCFSYLVKSLWGNDLCLFVSLEKKRYSKKWLRGPAVECWFHNQTFL